MEQLFLGAGLARPIMDRSFLAIATILHRAPPKAADSLGKTRQGDRPPELRDIPHGWIRVAL
jgi:hypothetical protein